MARATFTIAIAFLWSTAAAESPLVTVFSPCECRDNRGTARWVAKNDLSTPQTDAIAIQSLTPLDMYGRPELTYN
jgi:hypothetical protein